MVARNPLISVLIVTAVESELTKRGLTKAHNPDIKVAAAAAAGADLQAVGPTWNNAQYQVCGWLHESASANDCGDWNAAGRLDRY
jgi:hypothetical protein